VLRILTEWRILRFNVFIFFALLAGIGFLWNNLPDWLTNILVVLAGVTLVSGMVAAFFYFYCIPAYRFLKRSRS
jgi:hypothetical protein